ncbi:MAG: alpha-galactosidase [Verrucomicrobiota bacterium]
MLFDTATGKLHARRKGGDVLLAHAVARAVTASGVRHTAEPEYRREVAVAKIDDALGSGEQLVARCVDGKQRLNFEIRVTLCDARPMLVVETIARNPSATEPLLVRSVEPLRATAEDAGGLVWPGVTKLLTNGLLYSNPGRVLDFPAHDPIQSWWNVALFAGENREGLVIGHLENKSSLGQVTVAPAKVPSSFGSGALSVVVESIYQREFVLKPGASVSSDRLAFLVAPNSFAALEAYAQAIGDLHQPRLNLPVNGWCSWFSFYGEITEDEVVRQSEFVAKHLLPFGCDTIQLDDGFYRAFGDWEGNERFPHGMKWLAQKIRSLGLKPGIWLAPYVIAETADVFRLHPDWLVHNPDGTLKQIGSPQAKPRLYALDISHPGAAEWLRQLFHTAAHDWGYDMFKIDFVEWSLLAAERYHDPTATKAGLYRRGFEIMRAAIGPHRHLLDCGPGNTTVGLLDSMRIELDQPPLNWKQYFLTSASSAPAAAKRYYFHKRTWINDADHIGLAYCTLPQAQAVATIIALSGGNTIAGDRLTELDPIRLAILKKAFPSSGEAARPIDLFERDRPEIFALRIKRKFGEWLVLGLFNGDEKAPTEKKIDFARLGLNPMKTHLAFDFWNQRFYGELRESFTARLEPASVLLLSIHEDRGVPQFLSTDRHIAQGALELATVEWDAAASTLRGLSVGAPGTDHNVYLHLPDKHPWRQRNPFFFYDFPGYTLHVPEPQILRVHVRFNKTERVAWEVNVAKFFGG